MFEIANKPSFQKPAIHFRLLINSLTVKYGFTVNKNRERLLYKILQERLKYCSFSNLDEYCQYLLQNDNHPEWEIIIDQLTVKETYFFRNIFQFHYLEKQILPELMKTKWRWPQGDRFHRKPSIRILSAGCSTGEEAYSIAMVVNECIRYLPAWDLTIDAVDISSSAIKQAQKGIFQDNERLRVSIQEMNTTYLEKYFERSGSQWVIKEQIRQMIHFRVGNIKAWFETLPLLLPRYDVIFCRNVMIYFNYTDQCSLVNMVVNMLEPGGYVFMGDAEVLHIYNHHLELMNVTRGLIYRKNNREPVHD